MWLHRSQNQWSEWSDSGSRFDDSANSVDSVDSGPTESTLESALESH